MFERLMGWWKYGRHLFKAQWVNDPKPWEQTEEGRQKLRNLKEFKCTVCNPDLLKNLKLEPGSVVQVCKKHLQEDLHLVQERFHRRWNMEPVKVVVSPLDHDLRKLLWEVRYHLQARATFPLDLYLKKGKALGQRLEEALKEQDLPSSPPTKEFCAMCLGATREQAKESWLRICSTHQKPEEEIRG